LAQLRAVHRTGVLEQPAGADRRHRRGPAAVAEECVAHLRESTRGGRIRSTITVFAPDRPGRPGPRIHNEQLVRYAGYRTTHGVVGDGRHVDFTDRALAAGWRPPERPAASTSCPS
jgi:nitric-oxide synthase